MQRHINKTQRAKPESEQQTFFDWPHRAGPATRGQHSLCKSVSSTGPHWFLHPDLRSTDSLFTAIYVRHHEPVVTSGRSDSLRAAAASSSSVCTPQDWTTITAICYLQSLKLLICDAPRGAAQKITFTYPLIDCWSHTLRRNFKSKSRGGIKAKCRYPSSPPRPPPRSPPSVTLIPVVTDLWAVLIRLILKRAEGKLINPSDLSGKPPVCSAGSWGQRSNSQMGHISASSGRKRLNNFMPFSQRASWICLLIWGNTGAHTATGKKNKMAIHKDDLPPLLAHLQAIHGAYGRTTALPPPTPLHFLLTHKLNLFFKNLSGTSVLLRTWCDTVLTTATLLVRQQVCDNSAKHNAPSKNPFADGPLPWRLAQWSIPFYPPPPARPPSPPSLQTASEDGYTPQIMISPHQLCERLLECSVGSRLQRFSRSVVPLQRTAGQSIGGHRRRERLICAW